MKKVALLLVLVLAIVVPTMIHANGPVNEITPYIDGPDHIALSSENIVIRARWGACNRGLARQFTRAGSIFLEIDDVAVATAPATEFWEGRPEINQSLPPNFATEYCIVNSDVIWVVEWLYPLGQLSPGLHTGQLIYSTTRRIHDGGEGVINPDDYDGRIDGWPAGHVFLDGPYDFTIDVAPAP